jgi:glucose-1-phosphate thymidylyltransferase
VTDSAVTGLAERASAAKARTTTRQGILLAGGSGTRLYPMTRVISKQLLAVYDKPLVCYPLSTLMLANIRDVLVITTAADASLFQNLLGDGSQWGIRLSYAMQKTPDGIAQALLIARDHLAGRPSALILGDNIFYGHGLTERLQSAAAASDGATLFGYRVRDPERYGVAEFDEGGHVVGLEEKPVRPRSSYAVTGLYFYDRQAADLAAELRPSARGELEITDLNRRYLDMGQLRLECLGRGDAWLDTGTPGSLLEAANFIRTVEERQGLKIACLEEVAYRMGFVDLQGLERAACPYGDSAYGRYIRELIEGEAA